MRHLHNLFLVFLAFCGTCLADVYYAEKTIDGETAGMRWMGKDEQVLFVRSAHNQLYRSGDRGQNWVNLMDQLTDKQGRPASMIQDVISNPLDPSKALLVGFSTTHWLTRDAGEHFEALDTGLRLTGFKWHPSNPDWALASQYSQKCYGVADPHDPGCHVELFISTDSGKSWRSVMTYITTFSWANPNARNYNPNTVFFCAVSPEHRQGPQVFGQWDVNVNVYRTDDLFSNTQQIISHGAAFLWVDKFFYVATINPQEPLEVSLKVSNDNGGRFRDAEFPFQLTEFGYTVLDTSDGAVFVSVNHGCERDWGNLYLSNANGDRFSLSLRAQQRDPNGRADFERVKSVEGVYLANFVANLAVGPAGIKPPNPQERLIRTTISFDKGGEWAPVRPPSTNVAGTKYADLDGTECDKLWGNGATIPQNSACQLHLHGTGSNFGPFYSHANATGIILGTGNVASSLSSRADQTNTYMSIDGGLSWTEVAVGSNIYEFGDYGGLVVLISNSAATKSLQYSWNHGKAWRTALFADKELEVKNIVTAPSGKDRSFVVYGTRNGEGVVVWLDFSPTLNTVCQGSESPGLPTSDYELWSPSDRLRGGECLLGHTVQYVRRRPYAECVNARPFQRTQILKNCPCTEDDFECAFGYERAAEGGLCHQAYPVENNYPIDCPDGNTYFIKSPYQRVAGDTCDINDASISDTFRQLHEPKGFQCPPPRSHSNWIAWLIVGIVLTIAGALIALIYKKRDHDQVQALVGVWNRWEQRVSGGISRRYNNVRYVGIRNQDVDDMGLVDEDAHAEAQLLNDNTIMSFAGGAGGAVHAARTANLDRAIPPPQPLPSSQPPPLLLFDMPGAPASPPSRALAPRLPPPPARSGSASGPAPFALPRQNSDTGSLLHIVDDEFNPRR